MVYLIYEKLKGEDSLWFPYFDFIEAHPPTPSWKEETMEKLDYQEMAWILQDAKKHMGEEWESLNNLFKLYPQFFGDPCRVTYEDYLWAYSMTASRQFGYGLPCQMNAPFADCVNHMPKAETTIDVFNKSLHLDMNKVYLYRHKFTKEAKKTFTEDDIYDKKSSKLKINVSRLFKEDEQSTIPEEVKEHWKWQDDTTKEERQKGAKFSKDACFKRFKERLDYFQEQASERTYETNELFGDQLWQIGYFSSDHEEERDEAQDYEDDENIEEAKLELQIL